MAMTLWTFLVNVAVKIPLEHHAMKWSSSTMAQSQQPAVHDGSKGQQQLLQQRNHEYYVPRQQKQQQQKEPQSKSISSDSQPPSNISVPKLDDSNGQIYMLSLFQDANVPLDHEMKEKLPPWSQVQNIVGDHPYILGLENCATYRKSVPAVERVVGAAGMFNSGTNLGMLWRAGVGRE
jgi:hypothetical protein